MVHICILWIPEQWKCSTKLTEMSLFQFLICTLYFKFTEVKEQFDKKWRNNKVLCYSLFFYVLIFSKSIWLIREVTSLRKDMIWVSWWLMFVRETFSFFVWSKLWCKGTGSLSGIVFGPRVSLSGHTFWGL